MLIEETFAVRAPIEKVWDFLMDPDASGPCVPGCEKVEVLDDKTYRVRVKTKISFISGLTLVFQYRHFLVSSLLHELSFHFFS